VKAWREGDPLLNELELCQLRHPKSLFMNRDRFLRNFRWVPTDSCICKGRAPRYSCRRSRWLKTTKQQTLAPPTHSSSHLSSYVRKGGGRVRLRHEHHGGGQGV